MEKIFGGEVPQRKNCKGPQKKICWGRVSKNMRVGGDWQYLPKAGGCGEKYVGKEVGEK